MALITAPRNAIGRERPVISPFDQPNNCLARENAYAERKGHLRRRPGVALGSRQSPEFCVDLSGKPPHLNPCFRETTQALIACRQSECLQIGTHELTNGLKELGRAERTRKPLGGRLLPSSIPG